MKSRRSAFSMVLLFLAATAQAKPGDSVDSGRAVGRSWRELAQPAHGIFPLYEGVRLATQANEDHYVDYGPFENAGSAPLRLVLTRISGSRYKGMFGMVGEVKAAEGGDQIEFMVSPGKVFYFAVKGYAAISAYTSNPKLTPKDHGFPAATDFQAPTGDYLRCTRMEPYGNLYIYRAGSMSDRSHRKDVMGVPGITLGPSPPFATQCIVVEIILP